MKHLRRDGTVGEVDVMSTPIPSEDGKKASTIHSLFDRETGERIGGIETIAWHLNDQYPRPEA